MSLGDFSPSDYFPSYPSSYPRPHSCPDCGRCPTCGRGGYWRPWRRPFGPFWSEYSTSDSTNLPANVPTGMPANLGLVSS